MDQRIAETRPSKRYARTSFCNTPALYLFDDLFNGNLSEKIVRRKLKSFDILTGKRSGDVELERGIQRGCR